MIEGCQDYGNFRHVHLLARHALSGKIFYPLGNLIRTING
jgi:hypothetical protein